MGWSSTTPALTGQRNGASHRDTAQLQDVLRRCPQLHAAAELVRSFAGMPIHSNGQQLKDWMAKVERAAVAGG